MCVPQSDGTGDETKYKFVVGQGNESCWIPQRKCAKITDSTEYPMYQTDSYTMYSSLLFFILAKTGNNAGFNIGTGQKRNRRGRGGS